MPPTLPISVTTRFSFLGLSGWKSEPSRDAALLFEPGRLRARLALFRQVALASLAAQTAPEFHLHVLTSDQMPEWALDELRRISDDALGAERVTVDPRPVGRARKYHRIFLEKTWGKQPIAQVVLDDDDGLSNDFMAILNDKIAAALDENRLPDADARYFLSFPQGYGLVHSDGPPQIYRHSYKLINLGLTMLGTPARSIHSIVHQFDPIRIGHAEFEDQPMFLRSVHHLNDSRVAVTNRWDHVPDWRAEPGFLDRFGYIAPLMDGPPLTKQVR